MYFQHYFFTKVYTFLYFNKKNLSSRQYFNFQNCVSWFCSQYLYRLNRRKKQYGHQPKKPARYCLWHKLRRKISYLTAIRPVLRCTKYTIAYKCVIFTQRKKIFFMNSLRFLKKHFQWLQKTTARLGCCLYKRLKINPCPAPFV